MENAESLTMHDGTAYIICPCLELAADFTPERFRDEIRKGIASLSVHSRWLRFFSPVKELSEEQLDRLTDLDGSNRVAWCAVIETGDDLQGIGLSRYVRLVKEPRVAEFAVTVIDAFQGQGVGLALMLRLIGTAHEKGIQTLRGSVLPGNRNMLALCRHLGARSVLEGKLFRVEIDVNPVHQPPLSHN